MNLFLFIHKSISDSIDRKIFYLKSSWNLSEVFLKSEDLYSIPAIKSRCYFPPFHRIFKKKDHGVLKKRRGVWGKTSRRFYKTLGDIFYFRTLAITSFRQQEKGWMLENHCHGCQHILNLLIFNVFLW